MINAGLKIDYSDFATYELSVLKQYYQKFIKEIDFLTKRIKANPYNIINKKDEQLKDRNLHKLGDKKPFQELNGFYSLNVDKTHRLIWDILYDTAHDDNYKLQDINNLDFSEDVRTNLWGKISNAIDGCKADRLIFVYILNVFFDDHADFDPNPAACSIDYLLHEDGIEINPNSPFMNTKYSILKYDEYQKKIDEGNLDILDDSVKKNLNTDTRYPHLQHILDYKNEHPELF